MTSLSVDGSGTRALVGAVDGSVGLVEVGDEGVRVVARKETYGDENEDGVCEF